jgi:ATP-dependent DNA helicase RecQ
MAILTCSSTSPKTQRKWTPKEIRDHTQKVTGKRPCWFQIKVALAVYKGKDVVTCAPTGAGKTLSFWIPLLMALKDGLDPMVIVVTPLNLLGKQNVDSLAKMNLLAVAVDGQNAKAETFRVRPKL